MTGNSRYMPRVGDDLPAGERPMIAVLRAVDGHEAALQAAVATLASAVRAEPGCVAFRAYQVVDEPGTFYLYEVYADVEAFRVHLATAHVAAFFAELAAHSTADAGALTQLAEVGQP